MELYPGTKAAVRFRPLTGINFNLLMAHTERDKRAFPPPHGDKFQHTEMMSEYTKPEFPSPLGDKFQQLSSSTITIVDSGFRPLTGLNFNVMCIVKL